jgi:hypothetical protein
MATALHGERDAGAAFCCSALSETRNRKVTNRQVLAFTGNRCWLGGGGVYLTVHDQVTDQRRLTNITATVTAINRFRGKARRENSENATELPAMNRSAVALVLQSGVRCFELKRSQHSDVNRTAYNVVFGDEPAFTACSEWIADCCNVNSPEVNHVCGPL